MATRVHQRKLIRDAVVAALLGKTQAEDRVFASRKVPWRKQQLPAISVYVLMDDTDPASASTAPRQLKRTAEVTVDAVLDLDSFGLELDDAMDAFALQVEDAMDADPTFGDACSDSFLLRSRLAKVEEAGREMADVELVYSVTFYTDRFVPDGQLDDLATVDAKTSLGGAQAAADQTEVKVEHLDT